MHTEGKYSVDTVIKKSNFLIGSKYKSSILENKIMAISLSKIQEIEEGDNGILISRIRASELREIMNANDGSFYTQLENTARIMTGKSIGMSDPERKIFDYIAVIIRAHYEDGIFTIEYNPHVKQYIYELSESYTLLKLATLISFKSVFSFRLYEILKSKAYTRKGEQPSDTFNIKLSIAELKLELGVVNAELDKVRRVLKNSSTPDYEKAIEVSPEQTFVNWVDFRRKCLEVAIREINEKSDMYVEYDTEKSGRGGRIVAINFKVKYGKKKEISETEKNDIMDETYELLSPYKIKMKDVRAIVEAADYNYSSIKTAFTILKNSKNKYEPVGFMIAALRDNYKEYPQKKNQFTDIENNRYNFDELEKDIVCN